MTKTKTKVMLEVTFSDAEMDFVGRVQIDGKLDGNQTDLLRAAAKEIDYVSAATGDGIATNFSRPLAVGGGAEITFDSTQRKIRVIVFDNDRSTMPVTVLIREIIEWDI